MQRLTRYVRINQEHPGVSDVAGLFYWLRLQRYDRRMSRKPVKA